MGNYYEFYNPDLEVLVVGKVKSVDQDVIFYSVYQSCAEYFGQNLKTYHSEFELVRTDEISKEYARNIKRKVRVVRAAEFRKLDDR